MGRTGLARSLRMIKTHHVSFLSRFPPLSFSPSAVVRILKGIGLVSFASVKNPPPPRPPPSSSPSASSTSLPPSLSVLLSSLVRLERRRHRDHPLPLPNAPKEETDAARPPSLPPSSPSSAPPAVDTSDSTTTSASSSSSPVVASCSQTSEQGKSGREGKRVGGRVGVSKTKTQYRQRISEVGLQI